MVVVILSHHHIENPVAGVLHAPMVPHGGGELFHIQFKTAQVVASFDALDAFDLASLLHTEACKWR